MKTQHILVTGGCGFIGRHLVSLLIQKGAQVKVLDLRPCPIDPDAELITGSILDRDTVKRALRGVDRVFHLAADPNLWALDKSHFYRVNTEGTKHVLNAAMDAGVERFVYTSTESILKGVANRSPGEGPDIDEQSAPRLEDMPGPYCRSKFLAEQAALEAARNGFDVVVVNPTLPIGPGDWNPTPPTRMLLGFLEGRYPAYMESGFNLVDVRDIAQGHLLASEHGRTGERYILGGENLMMSQILGLLGELTGRAMPRRRIPYWLCYTASAIEETLANYITKKPPTAPLAGLRLARSPMTFDNSKAQRELGFDPRPVKNSLADAIEWYQKSGFLRPTRTLASNDVDHRKSA